MNALDFLNPAHRCAMVGRLVRTDKNVDDLIAVTLHRILKILDTPNVTQSVFELAAHNAIAKELLRLRDMERHPQRAANLKAAP